MSSTGDISNHRACVTCRGQKVRCIPDESNPESCQRCARTGRPCIVTPTHKRKQRKRTDTRVAELEREMRAMRAALKQKEESASKAVPSDGPTQASEGQPGQSIGLWYKDSDQNAPRLSQAASWERVEEDQSLNVSRTGPDLWPWKFQNQPLDQNNKDVIDRGMISMATARHLFETYRTDLFPHYPMVAIPASTTVEEMRKTKPALFLATIAAAAGKEDSELSAALDQEVLRAYATRSLVQSEKSLELVQALLISAVWYHPPTKFGQLKYYEYIHMAATMAMDIGIGSRPSSRRTPFLQRNTEPARAIRPAEDVGDSDASKGPRLRPTTPESATIESRRTFLACYIICAGVSLSLRRPNMLRVTSYIRECADVLECSPQSLPTDTTIVAWVRLVIISEQINSAFSYDDDGDIASIAELRTQLMLKDFEKRLTTWYTTLPDTGADTGSLMIMYYTIRLYLFEIALHVDHSPEDFRAPYQMGGIQASPDTDYNTQVLAGAVAECISSSHALIDTFVSMDVESCRALPVFSYVRISFSAFVLAKLSLSVAHPRSRIGKVLDRGSLKVETYMDRTIIHVRNIVGEKKSRVPSIFLALLFKLRQWSLDPEMIGSNQDGNEERLISRTSGDLDKNQRQVIGFNVPKITEHLSSIESSPQTTSSDSQRPGGSAVGLSSLRDAALMPDSNSSVDHQFISGTAQYDSPGEPPRANVAVSPQATANENPIARYPVGLAGEWSLDQMDIDNNLMQLLGDANAFSEGGLTGLDDWATMPLNFTGMDLTSWSDPETGNT